MFSTDSKNADIVKHDWAQLDRARMLRFLHAGPAVRTPAAAAPSGWGEDVTGNDPRSAHAYLTGKGDLRTTWWNAFSTIYMLAVPGATLERAMYSFHRMHHALTLARLGFAQAVARTAADIEHKGVLAAAESSLAREVRR